MIYTLDESAALLRLHNSTVQFWEEAFRNELNVARDPEGRLLFNDRHLQAINVIRRLVLEEKRPLAEARRQLRTLLHKNMDMEAEGRVTSAPSKSTMPKNESRDCRPGSRIVEAVAENLGEGENEGQAEHQDVASNEEDAQRGRSGGLLESRSDANPLGVAEAVNSLSVRITELGEAVGYLMEENRALQELIGRLIHFVEELGEARAKETPRKPSAGTTREAAAGDQTAATPTGGADQPHASMRTGLHPALAHSLAVGPGAPRPAGSTRPRLTLAEKRALIAAQREASRPKGAESSDSPPDTSGSIANHYGNVKPASGNRVIGPGETQRVERNLRPWQPTKLVVDESTATPVAKSRHSEDSA